MKAAVFYTSMSGNTREAAEIVASTAHAELFDIIDVPSKMDYDLLFFGTYTWGDGQLPQVMRQFLRRLLVEEHRKLPPSAVFGTGDSIFPRFCRAVDEIIYHLKNHDVPILAPGFKIEQSPYGLGQKEKLIDWTHQVLEAFETYRTTTQGGLCDE